MATTMDIQLENRTSCKIVYAYITGLALANSNQPCFIKADGKTPYYPTSPADIQTPVPENISIPLGAPGSSITVTIPQLAGGRIWFSLDAQLTFLLNPGPAIVEPSISNPTDPNINISWDFCEFTFSNNSIYANISYVDFVSHSISLTLMPTVGAVQSVLGLKPGGFASICAGLQAQGPDWAKLVFNGSNGQPLRALSPNNGIVINQGELFAGYYDSYVNEVYEKYSTTALNIDTQSSYGTMSGTVSGNTLTFAGGLTFAKPTTGDIFSCSTGPFVNNAGALGPLTARISAAFNRSTLLVPGVRTFPDGDVAQYYQNPITNHYSRLCHAANLDGRGYAFPYDDVSAAGSIDQSGFVNATPKSFIVSIS